MDKLTTLFFQPERWTAALGRAVDKDIRKDQLYQLTKPSVRTAIYAAVRDGRYRIAPPHAALIPKDTPGEFRRVYVNEPVDRVLLSIANDLLFETMPEMVHPSCRSYLKGVGCGDTVREASRHICQAPDNVIGWKSDLSKYFDSVPVRYIDSVFDRIEAKWGPSAVIALLRDYIKAVNAEIAGKKPRMHKGKPYVSVFGHNYHFNNVEANLYNPLRELENAFTKADNPKELLLCVRRFHRLCVGSVHKLPQSPAWVDAFKGAGAYFTLRNLVMFHGVLVRGCKTIDESLRAIDHKSMAKAGYKMFGMMKETLSFNNFDIQAKRSEWAQRYAQRAKALQANTAD